MSCYSIFFIKTHLLPETKDLIDCFLLINNSNLAMESRQFIKLQGHLLRTGIQLFAVSDLLRPDDLPKRRFSGRICAKKIIKYLWIKWFRRFKLQNVRNLFYLQWVRSLLDAGYIKGLQRTTNACVFGTHWAYSVKVAQTDCFIKFISTHKYFNNVTYSDKWRKKKLTSSLATHYVQSIFVLVFTSSNNWI